jgi:lambda family phage portal protein
MSNPMNPTLPQRIATKVGQWFGNKKGPQQRRFQAARVDRLTSDWLATEASINEELRSDLNLLRRRGRELVNNNDYAQKFRSMATTNIVGPAGFTLQARVQDSPTKPDDLANAAIEAGFSEWAQACDIHGRQSLRDLCETLIGGLPSDGEFLVRMVRGPDARNRFNFALQVIDVDRIDTAYSVGAAQGRNAVIMGVEVDDYRRPVAIHVFAAHPHDGVHGNRTRVRISTDETLHKFKVTRAEQLRGIPWMAPGMLSLHHLGGFMLSAVLAAEHGANHYGFFTRQDGSAPPIGAAEGPSGEIVTASQPGVYDTLPEGVAFTPHESKYPDTVFGPFVKTALQRIASGWCVAYHSLANDLEGVSFSSIRSGTLEERDRWAADQQWFIDSFLTPVYLAWLQMALLSSALTMPNGSPLPAGKLAKFSAHQWQGRRWEWVDPKNDMEAKILSVRAGLIAPQDLSAQMGYDFEDTLAKIGAAQKLAQKHGVMLTAYEATPGSVQAGQGAAALATPATPAKTTPQPTA